MTDNAMSPRVLAVRLDNVGDVVLLGPALRAVRAAMPDAHVTLLASPAGSQVAPMLPWVDDVLVERVVWQDIGRGVPFEPGVQFALIDRLRAQAFDIAFVFTSWSQSPWPAAYACYLAGIPVRVGESKEFGGGVLSHTAPPFPDEAHQVDRNLHLLEAVGIPAVGRELELVPSPEAYQGAAAKLASLGLDVGDLTVVAPGASCPARRYPPERFAVVVDELAAATGAPVVVVGSAREEATLAPVLATGAASLVGRTTVPELACVLSRATLVVTNDSGPMHLADAFRTPQVVLYSGTEYESQWEPRSSPARVLRRPTPCSPCYRFDCPIGLACLDISPTEVVGQCLDLLAATRPLARG